MTDTLELVKKLREASNLYYQTGNSPLSDAEYDALLEELKRTDSNNSFLKDVGAVSTDNKVDLPIKMGSLNKIRPSNLDDVLKYDSNSIVVMPKYDGLSMLIEYDANGNYKSLYTRGNGIIGQLITLRGVMMNFPKHINVKERTFIIGEAIVSKENWKKIVASSSYKVPRNFVCGILKPILNDKRYAEGLEKKNDSHLLQYIDIVAYGLVSSGMSGYGFMTHSSTLEFLNTLGFITATHNIFPNNKDYINNKQISTFIMYIKDTCPYETDGIVARVDDNTLFDAMGKESNGLNPKGARAIKLDVENQDFKTAHVKNIEWEISKRGIFAPVVVLDKSLIFGGTEVNRVSGVNAKYVIDFGLGIGAEVKVIKSGDVIPRIIETLDKKEYKFFDVCPYCGKPVKMRGVHIVCDNPECEGIKKQTITSFFKALDLKDVSDETISTLYNKGFNTIKKLLTIKYDDLMKLDGFQAKKSVTVERELNNAVKNITLAQLMYAGNTFCDANSSLGVDRLTLIINNAFTEDVVLKVLNNEVDENGEKYKLLVSKLNSIEGIGENCTKLFINGFGDFKKLYLDIKDLITFKKNDIKSNKLKDMIFAFTGFRNKALEKLITENGGAVKGVSKKCTVLFSAGGTSTKTQAAEKYGVKIVPEMEAESYLKNLIGE